MNRFSVPRLTANYRPIRQLISIRAGDRATVRAAVRHCSGVWGGVLNLIALEQRPGEWDEMTQMLASFAELDFITVLGEDAPARAHRLTRPSTSPPLAWNLPLGEMEPPFASRGILDQLGAPMHQLPSGDALPDYYAFAWGDIDTGDAGRRDLGNASYYTSHWSPRQSSALCRTAAGVEAFGGAQFLSDFALTLVPVPSPDALNELVLMWNLRAVMWPFHNGVGMLPLWDIDSSPMRARSALDLFLAGMEPRRRRVRVLDLAPYMDRARVAAERIVFAKLDDDVPRIVSVDAIDLSFGGPELPPQAFRLSAGTSVHLGIQPEDSLALALDAADALMTTDDLCAVDVLGDPRLRLPVRPHLGRLYDPNGRATGDGIAVLVCPSRQRTVELRVPSSEAIISDLVMQCGCTFERSSSAAHVDQLLQAVGGDLQQLILGDDLVIRLLRQVAPHRDERLIQADAAEMPRKKLTLPQICDKMGEPRVSPDEAWPTLSALVAARVLLAGIEVRCSVCHLRQWRIVDEVSTTMTCAGCRAQLPFAARDAQMDGEPRWSYSLNEAFSSIFAQGTAAVLLALARLRREASQAFHFLAGMDISLPAGGASGHEKPIEVDAVVLIDGEVVVLEVKSSGQLDQVKALSTLRVADMLGASACFATLETWDEPAREFVDRIATGRSAFRVLERADLMAKGDVRHNGGQ